MKKQKYYWKVVTTDDNNNYISAVIDQGKYKVTYKVGKYAKPTIKRNGLFVFRTRKEARYFQPGCSCIFKVKVRGKQIFNPIVYSAPALQIGVLTRLPSNSFPPGTCNFPEVMLVEKSH